MVLRNQVATSTPTPASASAAMSRTTSACERTRWRGETDTTTPASTPTCSFSSGVASGGTTASVLCTSFILPRRTPRADDGGFRSAVTVTRDGGHQGGLTRRVAARAAGTAAVANGGLWAPLAANRWSGGARRGVPPPTPGE